MLGLYLPAFLLAFSTGLVVPALPILVKTSFDIPFSTASLAITAAVVGSATATLPIGRLLDGLDRKLVAAFGPALVAIASVLVPRSTSFAELLLWQFIAGWGSQTWMLGRLGVLGDLATRDRLGRQMTTMIGFEAAATPQRARTLRQSRTFFSSPQPLYEEMDSIGQNPSVKAG